MQKTEIKTEIVVATTMIAVLTTSLVSLMVFHSSDTLHLIDDPPGETNDAHLDSNVLFEFIGDITQDSTTNPQPAVSQKYCDLLQSRKEVHCIMPDEMYAVRSVDYLDEDSKPVPYNKRHDITTTAALSQYDASSWAPPVYHFVRFIKKKTQDGNCHVVPICSCCPQVMDPLEQIALFDTSQFADHAGT